MNYSQADDEPEFKLPKCIVPGCDERVPLKRIQIIGKCVCLKHGDKAKQFTVAPAFNKGGYQLVTEQDVKHIGRK